jgi:hypothetical protein
LSNLGCNCNYMNIEWAGRWIKLQYSVFQQNFIPHTNIITAVNCTKYSFQYHIIHKHIKEQVWSNVTYGPNPPAPGWQPHLLAAYRVII